jgi:cation transporter-like permease
MTPSPYAYADPSPPTASSASPLLSNGAGKYIELLDALATVLPNNNTQAQKTTDNRHNFPLDWELVQESLLPLVVSTLGLICTGWLFDVVQHWTVFTKLTELFVAVPVIFSVKGNIELSLSSRLSTAANIGNLDRKCLSVNFQALLLQSMTCGFGVGITTILMGWVIHQKINALTDELTLLVACLSTCTVSSLLIGIILTLIIRVYRRYDLANPDNVATPFATSLGDFSTLGLLALIAAGLHRISSLWLNLALALILAVSFAIVLATTLRSSRVLKIVRTSASALVLGLSLTCIAGVILERFSVSLPGLAFLLPVTGGICNNFSAIYASRLSTMLLDPLPETIVRNRKTILTMGFLNLIIQLGVILVIYSQGLSHFQSIGQLLVICLGTSLVNLMCMLSLVRPLARWLHEHNFDLHSTLIPLLASLGDCLGALLLLLSLVMFK